MNILIINNGTIRLNELKTLLSDHRLIITDPTKSQFFDVSKYNLIVLTGGSLYPIYGFEEYYEDEINLIKASSTPIIGICLGFELICHSFGEDLKSNDEKIDGLKVIDINEEHGYFSDLPNLKVYKSHKWVIDKPPENFQEIASSQSGVEIIKHEERDLWGFQFHPEMLVDQSCGDEIFNEVLNTL